MTESEAIKACNTIVYAALSGIPRAPLNMTQNELAEAIKMAVKALEGVRVLQDRLVDVSLRFGEYMAIGTPEECLRNKDFLDFLSDKMDPDDFEMYLHIYNSLDEKGNNNDGE